MVRNTIAASVLKKNQELKTEKANKKLHGWGLRSVTDLVSKRNGLIDFYEKEGMFYVDILLPIEENLHLGNKVLIFTTKCDMIDLSERR